MSYAYYPGCTLHSTGAEYGFSAWAVLDTLGIEVEELEDWNCCGASSGHAVGRELDVLLAGRNLALAEKTGKNLLVPCAACYSRLRHAQHVLSQDEDLRRRLEASSGMKWTGNLAVESAPYMLAGKLDPGEIAPRVVKPLKGLKVAAYYGCLLTRPRSLTGIPNPDYPTFLDGLLALLGAEVVDWSYKTDCCGASLALTRTDEVARLSGKLVDAAVEAGAACLATGCPMCQANLEIRQPADRKVPVFYFTELMGLAFGLGGAARWWGKHLVDPRPLLHGLGLGR